jgi:hypothetical protein
VKSVLSSFVIMQCVVMRKVVTAEMYVRKKNYKKCQIANIEVSFQIFHFLQN